MPPRIRTRSAGSRASRLPGLAARALLLAGALVALLAAAAPAQPRAALADAVPGDRAGGALVDVVEISGILDRTVARHVERVLDGAAADGAEAVVIGLDVRAALGDSAAAVAEAVRASPVPVVTWVGPPGAHASGGGLLVALAGDLVAAAPGTLLGQASPVDLAAPGAATDPQRYEAVTGRAGAWPEGLEGLTAVVVAPAGGEQQLPEDASLPDGLGRGEVTVLAEEAALSAGLLDLTAASVPDLLLALDGREVTSAGVARALEVDGATARIRFANLGLLSQMLHAVANPALAYLLLVGGALALAFEVFQPGFGVAGVAGVATGAFGVYGLTVLPVRWLALALLLAGLALLAADLALGRLGLLTGAGTAGFVIGSLWLLPGPAMIDVPVWLVTVVTLAVLVYFVGVLTAVLRAQGNQALAGAERVVGETGVVRSMLNPEGHVFVGGALWRARAPEEAGRVPSGTPVLVLGLSDRLTLDVVPVHGDGKPAPPQGRSSAVG